MATNTIATTNKQTTERHVLLINGKPATPAEYNRIMNAKPRPASTTQGSLQPKPFSLL